MDRLQSTLRVSPANARPAADALLPNLGYIRAKSWVELGLAIGGNSGRRDEASRQLDAAIAGLSTLAEQYPGVARYRLSLAMARRARAEVRSAGGDLAAALEDYRDARDLLGSLTKAHPRNARYHREMGRVLAEIGRIATRRGDVETARTSRALALTELNEAHRIDPERAHYLDAIHELGR